MAFPHTNDCIECLPLSKMQIQTWPLPSELFVLSSKAMKQKCPTSPSIHFELFFQLAYAKLKYSQTHKLVELLESNWHTFLNIYILYVHRIQTLGIFAGLFWQMMIWTTKDSRRKSHATCNLKWKLKGIRMHYIQ